MRLVLSLCVILWLYFINPSSATPLGGVNVHDVNNSEMLQGLVQTLHEREISQTEPEVLNAFLSTHNRRESESHEQIQWLQVIQRAMSKNIYATANSALAVLKTKLKPGLSLTSLECKGSEEFTTDHMKGTVNFIRATTAVANDNDSQLKVEYPYSSQTASCPSGILRFPTELYLAPYEIGKSFKSVTNYTKYLDVIEFAREKIQQRKGAEDNMQPIEMALEVREYKHMEIESFLVGVLEFPNIEGVTLVVYQPSSKPVSSHYERDFIITFRSDINTHQVIISSTDVNGYVMTGHSTLPIEDAGILRRNDGFAMDIMSYNIWNFNNDWPTRKMLIVNTVRTHQPSIVGFQEIRYKYDSTDGNQLAQMATHLPNYNYVYQPAMRYDTEAEGVGILTTFPIVMSNYINLKYLPGSPDRNTRIALRALLDTPGGPFDFFVTHFSYAKGAGQMQNALDLLNFMDDTKAQQPTQAVVGDFNIYTDSVEPTDFLTGKRTFHGQTGNLRDVWETVHGKNDGFTFSNLPWSQGLINRADRILVRGNIQPVTVERVGQYDPSQEIPASDHLGVLTRTQ